MTGNLVSHLDSNKQLFAQYFAVGARWRDPITGEVLTIFRLDPHQGLVHFLESPTPYGREQVLANLVPVATIPNLPRFGYAVFVDSLSQAAECEISNRVEIMVEPVLMPEHLSGAGLHVVPRSPLTITRTARVRSLLLVFASARIIQPVEVLGLEQGQMLVAGTQHSIGAKDVDRHLLSAACDLAEEAFR